MISAAGLTKVYGGKTALDHADFAVRPGVVTGFLGPNGAGKSTAMRLILGLDRATAGSVTVNGAPTATCPRRSARWARCWRPRRGTAGGRRTTT